jgi:hypothetical protein
MLEYLQIARNRGVPKVLRVGEELGGGPGSGEGPDVTADFVFKIAIAGLFVFSAVLASMLLLRI